MGGIIILRGIKMIEKLFAENNLIESLSQLENHRQIQYRRIVEDIDKEPEIYFVGVDLAKPESKDYCVLCKMQKDKNGMMILKGIEHF
jgi:hypothetical protein